MISLEKQLNWALKRTKLKSSAPLRKNKSFIRIENNWFSNEELIFLDTLPIREKLLQMQ